MPRSRPLLLLAVLVAALAASPTAAATPSSTTTKAYAATASSPVALPAAGSVAVTVVLTNCGPCSDGTTSTQPFGSARVQLPVGVALGAAPSVDRQGWRAVVADDARSVLFVSSGRGTTTAVRPGEALTLAIPVAASSATGPATFSTAVKQSNDFSGVGNDFVRTGPDPVVVLTPAQVPDRIEFVQGPSTVQVSPATSSGGTVPVVVMCPAPQVRVVDAQGAVVTSLPPTAIALRSSRAGAPGAAGLVLDGAAPPPADAGEVAATTVDGVATFGSAAQDDGTCPSGVRATSQGLDFSLHASADIDGRRLSATAADTFDVLPVYALCGDSCTSAPLSSPDTSAQVFATGGSGAPDRLTFSVGLDPWGGALAAACDPDPGAAGINPYRQPVTVDLADHDKTVQLSWSKQAVQWATNNGASRWQVCLAAVYPFPTVDGQAQLVADGWYVGALLPCGDPRATGPCLSSLGRSAGRQTAAVHIPDVDGDPRMI